MKKTNIVLLALMLAASVHAGEKAKSDAEWLKQKHAQLSAVKSVTNLTNVGLWTSGNKQADGRFGYFPNGNGLIVFDDKTWVLIISHSMHAEDGLEDLTLIRTSDDRFLSNRGHVCDKLILDAPEKITSLETFLRATGKGAKGEATKWEPYTGEPQSGGYSPPAARSSKPTP
jgi:hypothetical protein